MSATSGVIIDLDGAPGSAHRLIRSIDTPLSTVQTHAPSLEDAYLEILREREV